MPANPFLDEQRNLAAADDPVGRRDALIARYAFAVPSAAAVAVIAEVSPDGVVEIGAGAGYWAHVLDEAGVDVVAFDPHPAPSPDNEWFSGTRPWFPVAVGDHRVVEQHPTRTLLMVWPTRGASWSADALRGYHDVGGHHVVYVGEGPGGRTGDAVFHALLGEVTTCVACQLGVTDEPCTCDVTALWTRADQLDLPHLPGAHDDLFVYERSTPGRPRGRFRRRWTAR